MTPEQAKALREPFPKSAIGKLPKGGIQLDYVGHAAVTDRLLAVDPDWSWAPFALTPDGLPALDRAGNLWIRLTICGVTRPGVGDGKNAKECISDAIRNAAMRFGVALDLWSKEELHPETGAAGEPSSAPTRLEVLEGQTSASGPPTADLEAEHDTLARTWGKLEGAFSVAGAIRKRAEVKKEAQANADAGPYRKWLGEQIASYKQLIGEWNAVDAAQESFPIPAGAKA